MREFLRRCPACGHRFVVKLQSEKLVDRETDTERIAHDVVILARGGRDSRVIPAGVTYEEVPIQREKFDVSFECNRCHHRWTETVFKIVGSDPVDGSDVEYFHGPPLYKQSR